MNNSTAPLAQSLRYTLTLTAIAGIAGCSEPVARSSQPTSRVVRPIHRPTERTPAHSPTPAATATDAPGTITLDGDVSDWPTASAALSDSHHAFFRFSVADEQYTLQAADKTTAIMLDADNNINTGRHITLNDKQLGVDVEVQFSPRTAEGKVGRGAALIAYESDGDAHKLNPYDWDLSCTPTYASTWYEARLSRAPKGDVPCATRGLLTEGTSNGLVATLKDSGEIDGFSPVFTIESTPVSPDARAAVEIPSKPDGALRVMSYNVLRSSPNAKPQVFQRIFAAIQPDIILVQEWESSNVSEITDWFNSMIPAGTDEGWHAVAIADTVQNGGGVAVVTRFPLSAVLEERPQVTEAGPHTGKPIRVAMAMATTPAGQIMISSAHLKSGGSAGSSEDTRRCAEARAINAIYTAKAPAGAWRIIAGDMNLVGSREPIEILAATLDADGSALSFAPTKTLGDRTYVTWSESGNNFAPGRLDWLLFSDSNSSAANAFVLDTSRLSDDVLARAGLTVSDSADATDHMPLVVDLVPVR